MLRQERKEEGGIRNGKYSAVQFLDEQAQTERRPAGTAEDKNNLEFSLMKRRLRLKFKFFSAAALFVSFTVSLIEET